MKRASSGRGLRSASGREAAASAATDDAQDAAPFYRSMNERSAADAPGSAAIEAVADSPSASSVAYVAMDAAPLSSASSAPESNNSRRYFHRNQTVEVLRRQQGDEDERLRKSRPNSELFRTFTSTDPLSSRQRLLDESENDGVPVTAAAAKFKERATAEAIASAGPGAARAEAAAARAAGAGGSSWRLFYRNLPSLPRSLRFRQNTRSTTRYIDRANAASLRSRLRARQEEEDARADFADTMSPTHDSVRPLTDFEAQMATIQQQQQHRTASARGDGSTGAAPTGAASASVPSGVPTLTSKLSQRLFGRTSSMFSLDSAMARAADRSHYRIVKINGGGSAGEDEDERRDSDEGDPDPEAGGGGGAKGAAGDSGDQALLFASNEVKTSQYTWWSFAPVFLYLTFQKTANLYFLLIGIFQMIPDISPTEGVPLQFIPLAIVTIIDAVFAGFEDYKRHIADDLANSAKTQSFNRELREFEDVRWRDEAGEVLQGWVESELPNGDINRYSGTLYIDDGDESGDVGIALTLKNMLLRGSKLRNTSYAYGLVVNTGVDSKIMMSSGDEFPVKLSSIDEMTNKQVIIVVFLLLLMSLVGAIGDNVWTNNLTLPSTIREADIDKSIIGTFVYYFTTLASMVPITLYVSITLVKALQAYFMERDLDIYGRGITAIGLAARLRDDFQGVKTVEEDEDSDASTSEDEYDFTKCPAPNVNFKDKRIWQDIRDESSEQSGRIKEFFTHLALCHGVLIERIDTVPEGMEELPIQYSASSPDEQALVCGAKYFGYEFIEREPGSVSVKTPSGVVDRDEELMQITEDDEDEVLVLTKGADNVLFPRLASNAVSEVNARTREATLKNLETFAQDGLRTLVICSKKLSVTDWEAFHQRYRVASADLQEGSILRQLDKVFHSIYDGLDVDTAADAGAGAAATPSVPRRKNDVEHALVIDGGCLNLILEDPLYNLHLLRWILLGFIDSVGVYFFTLLMAYNIMRDGESVEYTVVQSVGWTVLCIVVNARFCLMVNSWDVLEIASMGVTFVALYGFQYVVDMITWSSPDYNTYTFPWAFARGGFWLGQLFAVVAVLAKDFYYEGCRRRFLPDYRDLVRETMLVTTGKGETKGDPEAQGGQHAARVEELMRYKPTAASYLNPDLANMMDYQERRVLDRVPVRYTASSRAHKYRGFAFDQPAHIVNWILNNGNGSENNSRRKGINVVVRQQILQSEDPVVFENERYQPFCGFGS
ncbi:hypothetical protein PybrP1_005515, partial [[Pythium] brassicae (nom. inval.)]